MLPKAPKRHSHLFNLNAATPDRKTWRLRSLYCGICHSDIHTVRNEWAEVMETVYPCVPGHEIVGRVTQVGKDVKKFKAGDMAGVGCMVDSDRTCENCKAGEEQFCLGGMTLTYNSPDKHTGKVTYGGYSNHIVVDEAFVLKISPKARPCRCRAAALRRHHDLFTLAALEGRTEPESRCDRTWWSRTYGAEICSFVRRACRAVHDFAEQGSGGEAAGVRTKWCSPRIQPR